MLSKYLRVIVVTFGTSLVVIPAVASADCCSVNGGVCNIIPPLTHGQSGWMGAVCGTTLSGTNCVAKLDTNVTFSTALTDCITLGSGVTFDLNGYEMECTSSPYPCGDAVMNTSSSGGTSKVLVKNGRIIGPWISGVEASGGSNSSAADLEIDGAGIGIYLLRGSIEHVVIHDTYVTGIELYPGSDVTDSVIRNVDGAGISMMDDFSSYAGSDLDNNVLLGNIHSLYRTSTGTGSLASLQRSEVQNASGCQCATRDVFNQDECQDISFCVDVNNTTTPSFIQNEIMP